MVRITGSLALVLLLVAPAARSQSAGNKIVDLTDVIRLGIVGETIGDAAMKTFGIREVSMEPEMTFQKTTGRSTRVCLSTQIGTHMDAGAHVMPNGWPVDQVSLNHVMGPGVVVDARKKKINEGVTPIDLQAYDIRPGDAILILFKYEKPKPGQMFEQSFLTDEGARWLAEKDVCCVGTNTPGLENHQRAAENHWYDAGNQKAAWPVHKMLLSKQIPIIEGLINLDQLIGKRFQFIALPLKIEGADGSPLRAIAILK